MSSEQTIVDLDAGGTEAAAWTGAPGMIPIFAIVCLLGNCILACGMAYFKIARRDGKSNVFPSALVIIGEILKHSSHIYIPLTLFGVVRIIKIPVINMVLMIHGEVVYTWSQIASLSMVVVFCCLTCSFAATERSQLNEFEKELQMLRTQVFLTIMLIFVLSGFLYTACANRPNPITRYSLYNLAFPISASILHAFFDVTAKLFMEYIFLPDQIDISIVVPGIMFFIIEMMYFTAYNDWMYGNLLVKPIIPLQQVLLVITSVCIAALVLGEDLKHEEAFFSCASLLVASLLFFFYMIYEDDAQVESENVVGQNSEDVADADLMIPNTLE
jgi:hypothetical protein